MKKVLPTHALTLCFVFGVQSTEVTGKGKVTTMMNAYGGWLINTDASDENLFECTKNPMILQGDHAQYKELYSHILAAHMSGKEIRFYISQCDSNGYRVINNIYTDWGN